MYGSPLGPLHLSMEKATKNTSSTIHLFCLMDTSYSEYLMLPWGSIVWYIYLHEWLIFMGNVGKYTIHGSSGLWIHLHKNCQRVRLREKIHIVLIITHGYVDMYMASYPIGASNKRKYMHLSLTIYVQACGYFVYEHLWQKMTEPVWIKLKHDLLYHPPQEISSIT